jgi:hypothetical protein
VTKPNILFYKYVYFNGSKENKEISSLIFRRTTLSAFTASSQDSTMHTGCKETEAAR